MGDAHFFAASKSIILTAFQFGLFAVITLIIAKSKGYFKLPESDEKKLSITIKEVLFAFGIYLGLGFFVSSGGEYIIKHYYPNAGDIASNSWINFLSGSIVLVCLFTYLRTGAKNCSREIWKSPLSKSSFFKDILMGLATWLIAFPLVLFIEELLDLFILSIFNLEEVPHQIAVDYLTNSTGNFVYFVFAIITIVIYAPFIEELLFRGFLQTWLKKHVGRNAAILLSSLGFSLFHFAKSQGLGNITIVASLFILSCLLGFVYERQRSLIAPIVLHAAFNGLSIINFLFLKDSL